MSWGGAREGAGRKKAEIPKKIRGMRVTDDEWVFLKDALKKYRNGEQEASDGSPLHEYHNETPSICYQGESGASLLAHLEELYQQDYGWLLEYEKYLKSDYYEKYTPDEIKLQRELLRLQIVTLLPHLQKLNFSYEVKLSCSPKGVAYITASNFQDLGKDIKVKAWQEPDEIDFQEANLQLLKTYREVMKERERVKELERHLNDW